MQKTYCPKTLHSENRFPKEQRRYNECLYKEGECCFAARLFVHDFELHEATNHAKTDKKTTPHSALTHDHSARLSIYLHQSNYIFSDIYCTDLVQQ